MLDWIRFNSPSDQTTVSNSQTVRDKRSHSICKNTKMSDVFPTPRVIIALTFAFVFNVAIVTGQEYQDVALQLHNSYRRRHQAGPLTASHSLNSRAIQCAEYYAARGFIDHSCPHKDGAGENLWMISSSNSASTSEEAATRSSVEMWYSEESLHSYNGDWQPASGHFSQLVWNSSSEFGFGTGHSGQVTVAVALYTPHGNVIGQFRSNVFPPNSNVTFETTSTPANRPSAPETSSSQPVLPNRLTSTLNSTLTNFLTF